MTKTKKINTQTVEDQKRWANELLASSLPQSAKKTISTMIETLLMDTGSYRGFNYNYWMEGGMDLWHEDGRPESQKKMDYIIGADGYRNRDNDDWVSDKQGEYSRKYF